MKILLSISVLPDNNFEQVLNGNEDEDETPIDNSDVIKVRDIVYVLPNYENQCDDTLKAGGVYVVHRITQCATDSHPTLTLRHKPKSCITSAFVKKIKDRSKVLVCGADTAYNVRFTKGHILSSDVSNIPIRVVLDNNLRFWCYEDDVFVQEDNQ